MPAEHGKIAASLERLLREVSAQLVKDQPSLVRAQRASDSTIARFSVVGIQLALVFIPEQFLEPLTERQREVARLVGKGLSNKEIASKMGISPATVSNHLKSIFERWNIRTRVTLSRWAPIVLAPPPH